ncbi:MAG: S41 family peptidase [Chitinophagales bacterium]|nr:S41 family peptidase [Chitinophagales bacterium]
MRLIRNFALLFASTLFMQTFGQQKLDQGEKLREMMRLINNYYTDTVDNEKIANAAIVKMLEELDPHSAYIVQKDVKRNEEPLVGNFDGIGVTFQIWKDTIMINEVISGGPSQKVGLMEGDRIVKINDTMVANIKIENEGVIKRLRGPKGTQVKVGVVRRSAKGLLEFTITRDKIPVYSVEASYMAAPGIGYIKVIRFSATTMNEFRQAMEKLKAQGMESLIMDMEGNSGGYLNTAIQLCNEFIPIEKEPIVYTEGVHAKKEEYFSNGIASFPKGKLVVLIDEGSASAAEIFSGCMQDLDRAIIVGRRSFGKGLVQKPFSFADGSLVRLTVAHYYTSSGRCIQRPYNEGKKDYYDEYSKRLKSGELFGADTTHFPDSLLYFTKNKRKVFGGGGVVPDVFIPIDTSVNSEYYQQIRRKGVLNNFCTEYVDVNRNKLKERFPTAEAFVMNFDPKTEVIELLFAKADKDSIARDSAQIARSMPLFLNQTKSLIARNLFDNNTFWEVANQSNTSYKKAIELINTDQFAILTPTKKEQKKVEKEIKQKEKEKEKSISKKKK